MENIWLINFLYEQYIFYFQKKYIARLRVYFVIIVET